MWRLGAGLKAVVVLVVVLVVRWGVKRCASRSDADAGGSREEEEEFSESESVLVTGNLVDKRWINGGIDRRQSEKGANSKLNSPTPDDRSGEGGGGRANIPKGGSRRNRIISPRLPKIFAPLHNTHQLEPLQ